MNYQQDLIPISTGEYLKQQRIRRRQSLGEVAHAVRLDEKLLGDIESEQAQNIAPVYRNGYIRRYAEYLEVPEDKIRQLLAQFDSAPPAVRPVFAEPPRRNLVEKWLRASSYVLASLLIGTLAWQFTHEAVRLSKGGQRLNEQAAASTATRVAGTPQTVPSREPVNASIASLGSLHAAHTGRPDPAERAWGAVSPTLPAAGESRLQIAVSADSWVEISDADGLELEMDLLRGGSEKAYDGKPPFRILLGRASAVQLSVDGQWLDLSAYTRDDVARLSWPPQTPAQARPAKDQ